MNCQRCLEQIPLMPGGEVDRHTEEEVLEHIRGCDSCRRELEKYEFLRSNLGTMKELDDIDFNWERFSTRTAEKILEHQRTAQKRRFSLSLFNMKQVSAALLGAAAMLLFTIGVYNDTAPAPETDTRAAVESEDPGKLRPVPESELRTLLGERHTPTAIRPVIESEAVRVSPTRAWLGLTVERRSDGYLTVRYLAEDGPAERGGVRIGDKLEYCCGKPVSSISSLMLILSDVTPGSTVKLGILRNGIRKDITLTSGKSQHNL